MLYVSSFELRTEKGWFSMQMLNKTQLLSKSIFIIQWYLCLIEEIVKLKGFLLFIPQQIMKMMWSLVVLLTANVKLHENKKCVNTQSIARVFFTQFTFVSTILRMFKYSGGEKLYIQWPVFPKFPFISYFSNRSLNATNKYNDLKLLNLMKY